MDVNWSPSRVRRNFRIDTFSAICGGVYIAVLITFMPIVVRRLGGSTTDVAIVIAAPFVGHLLSPLSTYLLMGFPQVRVVAGTVTVARATFLAGVLVAATPLMLAMTTVVSFVIGIANISAYTALMQGIYPDRERASAMANVRIGGAIAGIAAAAVAGTLIDVIPAAWVFAAAALIRLPGARAFFWVRYDGSAKVVARRSLAVIARDVWADHKYRRLLLSFTVFGIGNLMNVAVYPILLVDRGLVGHDDRGLPGVGPDDRSRIVDPPHASDHCGDAAHPDRLYRRCRRVAPHTRRDRRRHRQRGRRDHLLHEHRPNSATRPYR